MCRLHSNTMPFYVRDVSVHGFWYPWGALEPSPLGYQGTIVHHCLPCSDTSSLDSNHTYGPDIVGNGTETVLNLEIAVNKTRSTYYLKFTGCKERVLSVARGSIKIGRTILRRTLKKYFKSLKNIHNL